MKKIATEISTEDLSNLIVNAIREEHFFTKDVLIPKIKSLITGFRLRLSAANYNKIENPQRLSKLIRANELHNLEKVFWKNELENIVGTERIKDFYEILDNKRAEWKA
jgi:hypothetical protein